MSLVYAVGDVHGRYDLLKPLLSTIAADADRAGRDARLILLGDYVDRGPHSAQVIAALVWLQRNSGFALHLLKGNHEAMMLDFLDDPLAAAGWIGNGGDATLASYGIEPPADEDDPDRLAAARDLLLDRLPASQLRLLEGLELLVEADGFLFVHAGIRPGVPIGRQVEQDLLWIREPFLGHADPLERPVVHGHSWTGDRPHVDARRIGVDTGAWKTGVLTAARILDGEVSFLTARDPRTGQDPRIGRGDPPVRLERTRSAS